MAPAGSGEGEPGAPPLLEAAGVEFALVPPTLNELVRWSCEGPLAGRVEAASPLAAFDACDAAPLPLLASSGSASSSGAGADFRLRLARRGRSWGW